MDCIPLKASETLEAKLCTYPGEIAMKYVGFRPCQVVENAKLALAWRGKEKLMIHRDTVLREAPAKYDENALSTEDARL